MSKKGTIHVQAPFPSQYVPDRRVDIWLPPGYDARRENGYPVLYMHDGQNVFDPQMAFIGVAWEVDRALATLEGRVAMPIVVAVWNDGEQRVWEYMPQRPFGGAAGEQRVAELVAEWKVPGGPRADAYLAFLVEELKPAIDSQYNTLASREHTLVMGSSMGGLISLYALCEYPQVFGAAGCLSTHWPGPGRLMLDYLREQLPRPGAHRIYFDRGDDDLDTTYAPYQEKVDTIMLAAGYQTGEDWLTRVFEGGEHSERAWQKRVDVPLAFLLGAGK
jgi:predicted alpha/beta superfamily hydrolase